MFADDDGIGLGGSDSAISVEMEEREFSQLVLKAGVPKVKGEHGENGEDTGLRTGVKGNLTENFGGSIVKGEQGESGETGSRTGVVDRNIGDDTESCSTSSRRLRSDALGKRMDTFTRSSLELPSSKSSDQSSIASGPEMTTLRGASTAPPPTLSF
jgi:hypothetical protein